MATLAAAAEPRTRRALEVFAEFSSAFLQQCARLTEDAGLAAGQTPSAPDDRGWSERELLYLGSLSHPLGGTGGDNR